MQEVRTRKSNRPPRVAAKAKAPPGARRSKAPSKPDQPAFLLNKPGPAFPLDITIPPHRGALPIPAAAEYLVLAPSRDDGLVRRRKGSGRAAKAKSGSTPKAAAAPVATQPAREAPKPASQPPASPARTLAEAALITPMPRSRALVRQDHGLVGRLVAWLGRLVPRKQRRALPRARSRIERPAPAAPAVSPVAATATVQREEPLSADLSRRMLLQLSQENERLRRELEALRASVSGSADQTLGEPAPA